MEFGHAVFDLQNKIHTSYNRCGIICHKNITFSNPIKQPT